MISIDELMISEESELAHTIVASTPCLPVKSRIWRFHSGSLGSTTNAAPASRASSFARGFTSMPTTTQPGRERDARGELTDETEAVDGHHLTELQLGASQRLDRDSADGDERGVAEVDVVGNGNDVVDRRRGQLGVTGRGVGDGLADLEALDVVAERHHGAGSAVSDLPGVTISCQIRRADCVIPADNTVCLTTLRIQGSERVCFASSTGVFDSVLISVPELMSEYRLWTRT